MFTYALMCLPFLAAVFVLDWFVLRTRVVLQRRTWAVMAVLLLLTLIFDQPMEAYVYHPDPAKSLFFVGAMPIEDLSYTIAVVIGMGALLSYEKKRD